MKVILSDSEYDFMQGLLEIFQELGIEVNENETEQDDVAAAC